MNDMDEKDRFERRLTEKIVAFSGQTTDDTRLGILWSDHQRNKVAGELSGDVMRLNANATVALTERNNGYSQMTTLPMKYAQTVDEYNLIVRLGNYVYGSVEYLIQYTPLNQTVDGIAIKSLTFSRPIDGYHGMIVVCKTTVQSLDTVIVDITVSMTMQVVRRGMEYHNEFDKMYKFRRSMRVTDVLRVRYYVSQYAYDQEFTSVQDDNELDMPTSDVLEKSLMLGGLTMSVIEPNVTTGTYEQPKVTSVQLYSFDREISQLDTAQMIVEETSGEIMLNVISNFHDIVLKRSRPIISIYRDIIESRFDLDDNVYAKMLQVGYYTTEHENIIDSLSDETSLMQTFALSVKNAQMLAELASKVVTYERKSYTIQGRGELAILHPLTPFYGFSDPITYEYDSSGANFATQWFSDMIRFQGTVGGHTYKVWITEKVAYSNGTDMLTETHQIYEDDHIWIFVRFEFTRSMSTPLQVAEMKGGEERFLSTNWSDLTYPIATNQVRQRIHLRDGSMFIRGMRAQNHVIIRRVIVCPKNAVGTVGHVSQNLNWRMLFDGRESSGICTGGTPEMLIYDGKQYNGIGYDVNYSDTMNGRITSVLLHMVDGSQETLETIAGNALITPRTTSNVIQERGGTLDMITKIGHDYETTLEMNVSSGMLRAYWVPNIEIPGPMLFEGRALNVWFGYYTGENFAWRKTTMARTVGLIFVLRGGVEVNTPVAPVMLGVTNYGNEYLYMQSGINMDIMSDIEILRQEIKTVADYVMQLRLEFERFVASQQPSFIDTVLQTLIDIALPMAIGVLGTIGGAVLSKLTSLERVMAGSSWRHTSRSVSQMSHRGALMGGVKQSKIPQVDINESVNFNQLYLKSRNKDLSSITTGQRPLYKTDPNKAKVAQEFDVVEKMDIAVNIKTGGRYRKDEYPNNVQNHSSRNNVEGELPLPTARVYYRPLGTLPNGLGQRLHQGVTMRSDIKSKLQLDGYNATNKLPSHSFMTVDSYGVLGPGKYRMTRDYFGIGELNTQGRTVSDKGAGIGHVNISYDSFSRTRDGKIYYTLAGYEHDGYTALDVNNLFETLFTGKRKDLTNVLTTDEKWEYISDEVSRRIISADDVASAVIGDQSRLSGMRKLAKSPMDWKYSLMYNNCQTFTNSMLNYVAGRGVPEQWNQFMKSTVLRERVKFKDDLLGISEASDLFALRFNQYKGFRMLSK